MSLPHTVHFTWASASELAQFLLRSSNMETKEEKMVQTQLNASAASPHHDSETFYTKLTDLLESSGFTLIFNVRETLLDLYLFYMEVTRRGGYHQVGREKKWGEVIVAMKLEGDCVKLCAQVEKLYAHILYQYEQLYFYRRPAKQAGSSSSKGPLNKKRNLTATLPRIKDIKDGQEATGVSRDISCHIAGFVEEPVFLMPPSNGKVMKRRRGAPSGRKNAYQIFLKHECARLKTSNLASDGQRVLRMAIDAWRNMSELEKQPYVEESKKNKEEIKEAMISHNKQQSRQDTRQQEEWPSTLSGDYLVTSQPEANESLVNKATIGLALKMTEKEPRDPSYLMEWDGYCALDLPTTESQ